MNIKLGLSLLSIGLASVACDRDNEQALERSGEPIEETRAEVRTNEPSTNEATAQPGSQSDAVAKLVDARCAREKRCGNIGTDKEYASEAACSSKLKNELADDLNQEDCPGGIVQKELDECLAEIRNNDCGAPLDTLERIVACRESDLCKAVE